MLTLIGHLEEVNTSNERFPKAKIVTDYGYNLVNITIEQSKTLTELLNTDVMLKISVFPKQYKERLFIEYKMLELLK